MIYFLAFWTAGFCFMVIMLGVVLYWFAEDQIKYQEKRRKQMTKLAANAEIIKVLANK